MAESPLSTLQIPRSLPVGSVKSKSREQSCFDRFQARLEAYTVRPKKPKQEKLAGKQWQGDSFVRFVEFAQGLHPSSGKGQSLLNELLRESFAKETPLPPQADELLYKDTKCIGTFCILVEMRQGHLISSFQRADIFDANLPMELGSLEGKVREALEYVHCYDFEVSQKLAHDFNERQWKYFPATLSTIGRRWTAPRIVPFVDRQLITAKGGFSTVWQVAIPATFVAEDLKARVGSSLEKHPEFPNLGEVSNPLV